MADPLTSLKAAGANSQAEGLDDELFLKQLYMMSQIHGIPPSHLWQMYQEAQSRRNDMDLNAIRQEQRPQMMPRLEQTLSTQGQWNRDYRLSPTNVYGGIKGRVF